MNKFAKFISTIVTIIITIMIVIIVIYILHNFKHKKLQISSQNKPHLDFNKPAGLQTKLKIDIIDAEILSNDILYISWSDLPYATSFEIFLSSRDDLSQLNYMKKIITTTNPVEINLESNIFEKINKIWYQIVARRAMDSGEIISEITPIFVVTKKCLTLLPPNLNVELNSDEIFLTWNEIEFATKYTLYFGDLDINQNNYVFKEDVIVPQYWYVTSRNYSGCIITVHNDCGESVPSAPIFL